VAIYFNPNPSQPPDQPDPSGTSTYRIFGGWDVYINNVSGVKYGVLGSPAGKFAYGNYVESNPFLYQDSVYDPTITWKSGFWGSTIPGKNDPWTVSSGATPTPPTVKTQLLVPEITATAGQLLNSIPVSVTGGAAIFTKYKTTNGLITGVISTATSPFTIIPPTLPAGLSWYPSKTNIVVNSNPSPTTSTSGGSYFVTYNISSNVGSLPVVGEFYSVRGQTKVTYNGTWRCTAVTPNTVTLKYTASPWDRGGVANTLGGYQGQQTWSTASYVTITDIDVTALTRPPANGSLYKDWVNYTAITIIGTPQNTSVGTGNYTFTFIDQLNQQADVTFKITIAQGAQDLSYTLAVPTRIITQGVSEPGSNQ